jgi:hypothetical protein
MEYDSQAESVYHFALMDMVDMVQIYGLDVVLSDILGELKHRQHILTKDDTCLPI